MRITLRNGQPLEYTTSEALPIRDAIIAWVLAVADPQHAQPILAAAASIESETDGFVRNGNRTNFRVDNEAFSSCKIEKIVGRPGAYDLNYSTMKDRRVHDIARQTLDHVSRFVFPPTPMEAKTSKGEPRLNHHNAQREKWLSELGFALNEIRNPDGSKKGQRWLLGGDRSQELIDTLNRLVPEHFEGTTPPVSTKQMVGLTSPTALGARTVHISLYKGGSGVEKDVEALALFVQSGYSIVQTNETAKMYDELVNRFLLAKKERTAAAAAVTEAAESLAEAAAA